MKSSPTYHSITLVIVAFLALLALPARADPLLTSAYQTQLETWFGQGDLVFTNIYTKSSGDNAAAFHSAVDGLGATFFLMRVDADPNYSFSYISGPQIVGGYNPQSWNSDDSYNLTPNDADRTAFIYNLSHGIIQRQNKTGEGFYGEYQTLNDPFAGPSFGKTDFKLDNNLNAGSGKLGNSYMGSGHNSYGFGMGDIIANTGWGDYIRFSVSELEVYTFTSTPQTGGDSVPDSGATIGLLALSMLGVGFLQRKFALS